MLTELHVENFKAWRNLKIELGKVTALFGENSSGKSSLLQFLLMLKQTKNAADRGVVLDFGGGPTELVNLGNYATAVHREGRADTLPDMKWTLAWRLPRELRIYDPLAVPRELLYAGDELQASALVGPKTDSQSQPSAKRLAYELMVRPSSSVQSGLADVMLAVAGHRNVQIVVESHSEHLLRRFQRRVAEGEVAASDLKLHFVRSKDGAAALDSLRLNQWGGIENWPDKFFGDEMGEIAATSRAGLERRMQANG